MLNIKALREELQELGDRGEAILAVAKKEDRDLTPDENKEILAIYGEGDDQGKVGVLQKKIAQAEKIIEAQKSIAAQRARNEGLGEERNPTGEPQAKRITVPARAKSTTKLVAYKGSENGLEDAYASGQFLMATLVGNQSSRQWCQDHGILAAHSTGDNTKGGFTVPEPLENALIRLVEERGVFRRNARVWPMASGSVMIPRRAGGFTTYFVGENSAGTPSDMSFDQIKLEAKKLMTLTQVSSELNEDTIIALAELVTTEIGYAFADKEDQCGFNGDGTSTYGGILGLKGALAAGSIQDAATGNDSALTLDLADFEALIGKLPQFPGIMPKFYVHSAVYWASMARLMDAAGGNTVENLGNGPVRSFLGYPVEFVQVLPSTTGTLASTNLLYFGDLSMACTMGSRRGAEIATDSSVYFTSDAIAIRATERFDINVHERGTASTAGPMLALKTAA